MSQITEKIKPNSNNRTLKTRQNKTERCPRGQQKNATTGLCEPIPIKTSNKTVLGCSVNYLPTSEREISRMIELQQLNLQALRDILSTLKGEPIGQKYTADARRKQDLIQLIICIESKQLASLSVVTPEPTVQTEPTVSPAPTVPTETTKFDDSIYINVDENINKPIVDITSPTNVDSQMNIGVAPADLDTNEGNAFLFNKEYIQHNAPDADTDSDFLYPELNDPNFNIHL